MRFSIAIAVEPLVSSPALPDRSPALKAWIERVVTGKNMFLVNRATNTALDRLYPDVSGAMWCGGQQT